MVSLRFFIPLALGLYRAANGLSIKDRFDVDTDSNELGGCKWVGKDVMDTIINECLTLAEAGMTLTKDYNNKEKPEAARLLDAFFQEGDKKLLEEQVSQIESRFTAIRDWLQNGGAINNGSEKRKPYLFCHDTWLQRKNNHDVALDQDGHEVWLDHKDHKTPVAIEDVAEYAEMKANQEIAMAEQVKNRVAYPYWSPKLKQYVYDGPYPGGKGYCSGPDSLAATQHLIKPGTVTLCPKAFGTTISSLSNKRIVKLRPRKLKPKKRDDPGMKSSDRSLQKLTPTSASLFHELFHLVLGNEATYPDEGEIYVMNDVMNTNFETSLVNPETFTLASVAYDYTLKTEKDKDGNPVEFFTSYASQG